MPKVLDNLAGKSREARLQDLAKAWETISRNPNKKRKKLLQLYASGFYGSGKGPWHTINLIDRGIAAIVPFLVEGDPRILVSTRIANYRPQAHTTQLALNYYLKKLKFAENVLIPAALNSMFGAAITRTDFYYDRHISLDNEVIRAGSPRVEVIDDSNYIGDPSAKRRCDFTFEGDIYTLPTEYAKEFFGGKYADCIEPDSHLRDEVSPADIANPNFDRSRLSLREFTTFMDLYLYDENTIITIMPKGRKAVLLREREWDGPPGGPYDYLGYRFLPESPIPIPPAWSWHDMDVTVNKLIDKMREMAEAQKDIIIYTDEVAEEAERVRQADNLGMIRVPNIEGFKDLPLGGIKDTSNWDWVTFMMQEQTKQGANPDVLAGRGAQAPTLGQEQLIYQNATRSVGNMYSRFQNFMTGIVEKLAWAFWTDPSQYVPVVKEIPGFGPLPTVYSSADKVDDFYDFAYDIEPFSTQRMSPEMRFQKTMQFMLQWILPTLQLSSAQGASLDIPTVTKILADYAGLDNFAQYYRTIQPEKTDSVPFQMQPVKNQGQGNDSMGAAPFSKEANMNQQQLRTNFGEQDAS